jgi:class 3 adenylate cyclase
MVEHQLPKLNTGVRFPSPAPGSEGTESVKNITVSTKIAVAIMLVAVGALAVTLIYGAVVRDDLTQEAIEGRAVSASVAKSDELQRYLGSIESGVVQLASSGMTIDAAQRFASTYRELPALDTVDEEQQELLLSLYRDEFVPDVEAARGRQVSPGTVTPSTDAALYLQTVYANAAVAQELDPTLIDDADDGSSWSEVHKELHPLLRDSALTLGFSDVLIIDPQSSAIVYSAAKKTDFGTSLELGPVGGTAVSSIVDSILRDPVAGTVTFADFSRYDPDIASPMAFAGSPILDGDRLVGVLVAKISPDEISRITTQDADWSAMQLGETGEIFVVGTDGLMRSDSRLFIEQPQKYLVVATDAGTLDSQDADGVRSADTTVLFQRIGAGTLDAIKESDGEMIDSTSYLNRDTLTAVQPVESPFGDWLVVFQVGTEEAFETNSAARIASAITVSLFVLLLTFFAASWAETFMRPVRVLSMRLHSLAAGANDSTANVALDKERTRTTREFADLTDTIDEMLVSLRDREESAALLESARRDIVRQFLPGDVATRIESGDRSIEQVEHATVVSVVIADIGRLVGPDAQEVARGSVEQMVETLDSAADLHGLRRVKVVGDAWVAVCGLDTPRVDHIARSIRVAMDTVASTSNDGQDDSASEASVGVSTGPVSAGLAGSEHLIYDAWGPTVAEAGRLARIAPPGTILVSEAVVAQLPTGVSVTERSDEATSQSVWSIDVDRNDVGDRP